MSEPFGRLRRFLRKLKRRKVYRVAATYAVVGFVLIQVADLTFVRLGLPSWTVTFVVVLVAVGFPLSLVLAWAFEVTPEGVRRTPEVELEAEKTDDGGASVLRGYKVLVGLGLIAATLAGGWYLTGGGGGESLEVTQGTVAVFPFQVSGPGTKSWREGMVTMLGTGLDGAAGLRAIADQTVLAAWELAGQRSRSPPDAPRFMDAARRVGAQYAIIGSAAKLGGELQLSADVHAIRSGERLDRVEVRGSPDSVTALTEELTRRVIGVLAAKSDEGYTSAELASVLTESVEALKLYLSGLQHERAAEYEASIKDYRGAIRADTSFALAYARIGLLGVWRHEAQGVAMRRANEFSDQLPERERRLVRAVYLGRIEHRTLSAADSLRRLTEDYPDDPSIWHTLGEFVLHTNIPDGWQEGEESHRRAVRLDPGNLSYYDHYVGSAFINHHDSTMVARRVGQMPRGPQKRLNQLALKVVFGTSETRKQALARYDTVSFPEPWVAYGSLEAPEDVELLDEVLRKLLERNDLNPSPYVYSLLENDLQRGRPDQFLRNVQHWEPEEDQIASLLVRAAVNGVPVPDSLSRRYLGTEQLPTEPSLTRLYYAALYGVERGETQVVDRFLDRLESGTGDDEGPLSALQREAVIQEFEGFRAWKEGDLERARRLLARSNESGVVGALWRGDLYRKLGERETAEGWYRTWQAPVVAYERLGQLYEEMGEPEKAAAAYRRFIAAWEDADPELQPRVEAARKRLKEMTASETGTDD